MDTLPSHVDNRDIAQKEALRPSRRRSAGVWIGLMVVGVCFAVLSLRPRSPFLIWNFSDSVPVGLYRIDRAPPAKGDLVAIEPGATARAALDAMGALPAGRLLLKHLEAISGDTVCRDGASVVVNGTQVALARLRSQDGRSLPAWSGCRALGDGEVLVLAPSPLSFDGRYFGPISTSEIVGVARAVLTFPADTEAR